MATKITMPQLGESVAEGTIGRWLKQEGDTVKKDESLVEIITDKVTAELPSPVSGKLTKILVGDDQTVKVGVDIAEIEESGGTGQPQASQTQAAPAPATPAPSAPTALNGAGAASGVNGALSGNGYGGGAAIATAPVQSPTARASVADKVSPLARRMAQEHNLDLNQIQGTGEAGRVRKEDILAFLAHHDATVATAPAATVTAPAAVATQAPQPVAAPPVTFSGEDQVITPTPARRAIAEHMVRSRRTSPHANTLVEVDMTGLARWLERYKDEFKRREGVGVSYQTFVILATIEALKEFPTMNASWTEDDKIILRKAINIGVSIALDDNLVVPVIRNADALNLVGLARALNDLVNRARTRRLMADDLKGATFTVNNPGVFGTLISMAIINQPNAGILTMDAVEKRPVVVNDAIAIRQMMYMSLSFDHRLLDGLVAARFLGAIKRRIEGWGPESDLYV